jgi:hypothetical protein
MKPAVGYRANRAARRASAGLIRIVAELPVDLIISVDQWGAATGKDSRRASLDALLRSGLKAEGSEE